MPNITPLQRAQGCLLGQLAGDALGSQVEFLTPQAIHNRYPEGLRTLRDGGTWRTLAGQPTDDSEMALALARQLVRDQGYNTEHVRQAYVAWLHSDPFDCGGTVRSGLSGRPNRDSQANGALMRISPLAIATAFADPDTQSSWAATDARLTHPHDVCVQANRLYVDAIASAIRVGTEPQLLYTRMLSQAEVNDVPPALLDCLQLAAKEPPADYVHNQGWVIIALHNAVWQLLHAADVESALVDTVMQGGDTDTNAAICGALLGAVHGIDALPRHWVDTVLACRPEAGLERVKQPRPAQYWPGDALHLAEQLLAIPRGARD